LLRLLEEKGHITHKTDGIRYVYAPTVPREEARDSALKHMMRTFFDDSTEQAVAAILDLSDSRLSDSEFDRLSRLIEKARTEGR
jgi:predicted transcriptional regulator